MPKTRSKDHRRVWALGATRERKAPRRASLGGSCGVGFGRRLSVVNLRNDRPPLPTALDLERLPGGFKVIDANGQSLAYFYARENDHDANTAGVLTMDEARRMASNFAKLPELLGRARASASVGASYWYGRSAVP